MWVPAVRPEDEKPVEKRLDVSHIGFTFRKDPEDTTMLLRVPVFVEVVDTGKTASVMVWVVYMLHITCPISWVACHHGLRPFPDCLVSQAAGAHGDEPVDQIEQEADRFAAALCTAHPGDFIPTDRKSVV